MTVLLDVAALGPTLSRLLHSSVPSSSRRCGDPHPPRQSPFIDPFTTLAATMPRSGADFRYNSRIVEREPP